MYVYNEAADTIDIGGHSFATRRKWRDVGRNPEVALVIDDLLSPEPWHPRMLEIRGRAERLHEGGKHAIGEHVDPEMFRIHPRRIQSVGINGDAGAEIEFRRV
jgi:pyridoxamine 5'-phosphate oxidase family protein